ncbi:hypothetical protein JW887_00475 [Candidatus Dojkabacteria bacterium]|nr:hypothetical protein [Candidatus Dojkabacteria bacterium]
MQLFDIDKVISEFAQKKITVELERELTSGKEAKVYVARFSTPKEKDRIAALKIYKDYNLRSFKKQQDYTAGRHIGSRTIRAAVKKKNQVGRQYIQNVWVSTEFKLLNQAYQHGCNVPEPYFATKNAVMMEYVGEARNEAFLLKDSELTTKQYETVFNIIFENMIAFFDLNFVHGDLSAFNILCWNDNLFIIDFPQAVSTRSDPNAKDLLLRDFDNIQKYFENKIDVDFNEYKRELYKLTAFI